MGKTADLTVVQKTIIDTLHKEGKTQTFITKEAVHRVLYPSMLTKVWVEEKDAQPTERTAVLWGLSSKIDSRIWVNFTRNELRLGSRHQEHHTQTCRGICYSCLQRRLTWAKEKKNWTVAQWSKVLFSDESKFVFHLETKVLESGGRVEKLIAQVAWSPVLSFHSLWWSGVQCHLLVLVHCVFETTSLHPFTKKCWSTSCFLLLTSFSWKTRDQNMQMSWRPLSNKPGLHTTSAVPQTDHLHATPNWGSN